MLDYHNPLTNSLTNFMARKRVLRWRASGTSLKHPFRKFDRFRSTCSRHLETVLVMLQKGTPGRSAWNESGNDIYRQHPAKNFHQHDHWRICSMFFFHLREVAAVQDLRLFWISIHLRLNPVLEPDTCNSPWMSVEYHVSAGNGELLTWQSNRLGYVVAQGDPTPPCRNSPWD